MGMARPHRRGTAPWGCDGSVGTGTALPGCSRVHGVNQHPGDRHSTRGCRSTQGCHSSLAPAMGTSPIPVSPAGERDGHLRTPGAGPHPLGPPGWQRPRPSWKAHRYLWGGQKIPKHTQQLLCSVFSLGTKSGSPPPAPVPVPLIPVPASPPGSVSIPKRKQKEGPGPAPPPPPILAQFFLL